MIHDLLFYLWCAYLGMFAGIGVAFKFKDTGKSWQGWIILGLLMLGGFTFHISP